MKLGKSSLHRVVLADGEVAVTFLNYGAITRDWTIAEVPMVRRLNHDEDYLTDDTFTGIIAGRIANRTANGRFATEGKTYQLSQNDGANHLHGGTNGLGRRFWSSEPDGPKATRLSYHSPDGEEGYPGAVDFQVDIRLSGHRLTYDMRATPDRPTPINMAQHNYYTLGGQGPIWGQNLWVNADRYTPVNAAGLPLGDISPVDGSGLDFRRARPLNHTDSKLDTNVLFPEARNEENPVAQLSGHGYTLQMWSNQPGAQLYSGGHLPEANTGFCIEPQAPPDAVNQPQFPSIFATPDQPYRQILHVDIRREFR